MIEVLVGVLVGLTTGTATCFFAWWMLFHRIVPSIRFSPCISKTPTQDGGPPYRYRVKLENSGRRGIVDIEVMARLRIKALVSSRPTTWQVVHVPVEHSGEVCRIPKMPPVRQRKTRTIVTLYINKVEDFGKSPYPAHIRRKAEGESLLLEDLLAAGKKAEVIVMAFGYDEFSGARKVFVSKAYRLEDVKEGFFDRKGLDVVELPGEVPDGTCIPAPPEEE